MLVSCVVDMCLIVACGVKSSCFEKVPAANN